MARIIRLEDGRFQMTTSGDDGEKRFIMNVRKKTCTCSDHAYHKNFCLHLRAAFKLNAEITAAKMKDDALLTQMKRSDIPRSLVEIARNELSKRFEDEMAATT